MELIANPSLILAGKLNAHLANMRPNTRKNYKHALLTWAAFLGNGKTYHVSLETFSRAELSHVQAWISTLRLKGLSDSTIALYLTGVSSFYELLQADGAVNRNPFRHPLVAIKGSRRTPMRPTQDLGATNVDMLLRSIDVSTPIGCRDYAMLGCLLGGGLRKAEVLNLFYEDVSKQDGVTVLRLLNTKTSSLQLQSLPCWAANGLWRWMDIHEGEGGEALFWMSSATMDRWFKRLLYKAGIWGPFSIHSCRVAAINHLLRGGVTHSDVRLFSRHSSVATVEGYDRRITSVLDNPGLSLDYRQA